MMRRFAGWLVSFSRGMQFHTPSLVVATLSGVCYILTWTIRGVVLSSRDGQEGARLVSLANVLSALSLPLALLAILLFVREAYRKIGVVVEYRASTSFDDLYSEARRLTQGAKSRIRIVNRWPDDRPENAEKAKEYYQELLRFCEQRGRLTRILQVPSHGKKITGHIDNLKRRLSIGYHDPHLREHLNELCGIRDRSTRVDPAGHIPVVLVAPLKVMSTFIIYDDHTVMWPMYIGDPFQMRRREISLGGLLIMRDPSGHMIEPFIKMFDRIDAQAVPFETDYLV